MRTAIVGAIVALAVILSGCAKEEASGTVRSAPYVEPSPSWVAVATMEGSGQMFVRKSEPFVLNGGEQKLVGYMDSARYGTAFWGVTSVEQFGPRQSVFADESGDVMRRLYLPAGSYYIDADTMLCDWQLTLYELR